MIRRCYDQNNGVYSYYGGRGIKVCDRWLESYQHFLADMGPKPSPLHSIERRENEGNYTPGNCYWATKSEQARNRRTSHRLEFRGQTKTIAEWAETTGIPAQTIELRLRVCKYPVEKALTMPVRQWKNGHPRSRKNRVK